MAFVNEVMSEEDKAKYDWSLFKAWSFSPPYTPTMWTVDRTKDVFFVMRAGLDRGSELPKVYLLYWKGHVVRLEAIPISTGNPKTGLDVVWNVSKLEMPDSLRSVQSEVLVDIHEAIAAYGNNYRLNPVNSVSIHLPVIGSE